MTKPGMPRVMIRFVRDASMRMLRQRRRSTAFFPVRKSSTHTQDTAWLMIVAQAAPCTPRSSVKMKMGSSTMLMTAPMTVDSMPMRGKPCALI